MLNDEILFFGCSYTDTNGGFVNSDKMYPTLMSNYFNRIEKNFAKKGCGNYRSFDVLSKTSLQNNSILIFQITELSRIQYYDNAIKDISLRNTNNKCLLEIYNDNFLIYEVIRNLNFLTQLCRAKQIKLVIWSIARFGNEKLDTFFENKLSMYPEYVYLDNSLDSPNTYRVDNGYDGIGKEIGVGHPGPKSNKLIFEKLIIKYNQLYNQN